MSYGDEREEEKMLSRIFSAPPTAHPSLFYFSIVFSLFFFLNKTEKEKYNSHALFFFFFLDTTPRRCFLSYTRPFSKYTS